MDYNIFEIIMNIVTDKRFIVPVITVCVSILLIKASGRLVQRFIKKDAKGLDSKRKNTIIRLLENIIKYIIIIFAALVILSTFGVNVTSIIAGLGVAGVVAGLALQDALKDIIMGCNIILDNYFVVGDVITYNGFTGEVVEFGLKNTKIKNAEGTVFVVSNRQFAELMNLSQQSAKIVLKVPVAYEEREDKVSKVLNKVLAEVKTWEHVIDEPEYLGIDSFADSCIYYAVCVQCVQGNQWAYKRQINGLIKKEFDKNNIKIPYPQVEVHNGKKF